MADEEIYTALDGAGFIQYEPGKEVYYIGECFDADALTDPRGSVDPVQCYSSDGRWRVVGKTKNPPDKPTTTLTGLNQHVTTVMEALKDAVADKQCGFVFYGAQGRCGRAGVFDNHDKFYGYGDTTIVDNALADWLMRNTDNPTTNAYSLEMMPGRIDMRQLVGTQIVTDSDQDLNALAVRDHRCASACGYQILPCDEAIFGGTGAVAASPDVQEITGGGATATDVANFPFAVDENVESIVRFMVDANTERWLAAREADGVNMEVAYTDDGGATAWNDVTVAAVNEGAQAPQALFALDYEHVWLVTDAGNIYFSSDGGLTWTEQYGAGTNLYAVHFANARVGFAVGAADEMYKTTDGGTTWQTLAGTGGGGDLLTVHVFSEGRAQVGTDDADIWMTWDGGANWTQLVDFGTGTVPRLHYWSELRGVAIFNSAVPQGRVYQTSNGGNTWKVKLSYTAEAGATVIDNDGLNDIEMGSNNCCYIAGDVEAGAGTAIIVRMTG